MCLAKLIEVKTLTELEAVTGYRNWITRVESLDLESLYRDYTWKIGVDGPHEVLDSNSGLYSYNYNSYNYYHNNHNCYIFGGIISQFGKVSIHLDGYRSEYAKIKTLFTIRENDAKGNKEFFSWIKEFNNYVRKVANRYQADTIHWQDFIEANK